MDSKLLLVKSITLIYLESLLPTQVENSSELVREVVSLIKTPEIIMNDSFGRDAITALKATLIWMIGNPIGVPFDKHELLQRIRVNVGEDESLHKAISDVIEIDHDMLDIQKLVGLHKVALKTFLNHSRIEGIIMGAYNKVFHFKESVDWRHFVSELQERLEPYRNDEVTIEHSSVVQDVDFDNPENLQSVMSRGKEELSKEGVIRFGFQGLNRMFGDVGGGRRGEMIVVGALQHQYKSGMLLSMMKHAALYNVPYMRDPTKKPLLLRISFENKANDDVLWLYQSLMENEWKQKIDLTQVDPRAASEYVGNRMQAMGYKVKIIQIDPSDYTYHDMIDLIEKYESEGYEIHAIFCDYLAMMSKKGCTQGAQGQDVRDLFRRVRNYIAKKGILFITPHQLSTEAKNLIRMGAENFVQEVANKGYYDSCRTIDQEVDMEIYIHKVVINGEAFLTMQRGKHRKVSITSERDLYCVLKFHPIGGILDDINGNDLSRRSVGGGAISDGGEEPWYKMSSK